jgi:hypothetical protein
MAQGELVPLVLLPRYSSYVGASDFVTIAMDVTEYQTAIVNCWRGILEAGVTLVFTFQESTDQVTWSNCAGTNTVNYNPGVETEGQASATLAKKWFRVKVTLAGTGPAGTCWAVGFLEQRLS